MSVDGWMLNVLGGADTPLAVLHIVPRLSFSRGIFSRDCVTEEWYMVKYPSVT